jgi:hypothetical protein
MRFTLSYTEGNEAGRPDVPNGFNAIQEAKEWCDKNKVPYYVMNITEWTNLEQHSDFHEIVASDNFDRAAEDNWEDLSKAIVY